MQQISLALLDLEKKVLTACKEAKENVKFLQIVEKYCSPLYRCNIPKMKLSIVNLIKVLRLIYSYSTHYRSFTNMTILFTRVTNQMIRGCMDYLTERRTKSIWEQPVEQMLSKLNDCISLNEAYQNAYHKVCDASEAQSGTYAKFNFSEIQIFGDFDEFTARLRGLTFILQNIKTYSAIKDLPIEDKQQLLDHLERLRVDISSKSYDYLSLNNTFFARDLAQFTDGIKHLEQRVEMTLSQYAQHTGCVYISLVHLLQMETMDVQLTGQMQRYKRLLSAFRAEMEDIAAAYTRHCDDPPLDRDMPPFADKQQLLDHLERLRVDISSKSYDYLSLNNTFFARDLAQFTDGIKHLEVSTAWYFHFGHAQPDSLVSQ
ncbi:hypothetical protein AHF37_07814 [Paragonimus kellicotti]|nr:hypothetical protein AHF37_07814 [Paragonimus kellicotti]